MGVGRVLAFSLLVAAWLWPPASDAQPGVDAMIEQLAPKPRTRSMRNLLVEPQPEAAPAPGESAPSLDLRVQFAFDSARVLPESLALLQDLAHAMQSSQLAASRFSVEGHTDAKGRAGYNQRLSQRRADAVRAVLVDFGIEAERLVASGKGATEPLNVQDPHAPENRRVRVVNLDPGDHR